MNDFMKNYVKTTNNINQHIQDNKKYSLKILSNGLKLYLIENTLCEKSSAYFTVNVGTNDNYLNYLGIAHFLEHMLFLGSDKYPSSNEYFDFVGKNGGSSNAYTGSTHTCYHFDIDNNDNTFEKALDIFSGFFICPLLDIKYIESESHAVNAEHLKNMHNHNWRDFDVSKKFFNQQHIISKFGTGNNITLLHSNKNIEELTENVKRFFNEKYSSDKMALYIYHSNIDSKFIQFLTDIFSKITKKIDTSIPNNVSLVKYEKNKIKCIDNEPYLNIDCINMCWIFKKNCNRKGNKIIEKDISSTILSDIFDNNGSNSLFEYFNKKGLIVSINTDETKLIGDNFLFEIKLLLSNTGKKFADEIIRIIFGFIQYIKKSLYDKNNIDYYKKYIESILVKNKLDFKVYNEIQSEYLLQYLIYINDQWDIDFENLLIENVNITSDTNYHINCLKNLMKFIDIKWCMIKKSLTGNKIDNPLIDEFYGTKYKIYSVPIEKYMNNNGRNFLPINYGQIKEDLLNINNNIEKFNSKHSIFIDRENPYKCDMIRISLEIIPYDYISNPNPEMYLYLLIYLNYINMKYISKIYDLNNNLIYNHIGKNGDRVNVSIECYPNMAEFCFEMISNWLKNTITDDKDIIDGIFELLCNNFKNAMKKEPYVQIDYDILYVILDKYSFSPQILLSVLNKFINEKINIKKISDVIHNIIKNGKIYALISGNVSCNKGDKIARKINNMVNYKKYEEIDYYNVQSKLVIRKNNDSDDINSVCVILYRLPDIVYNKINWDAHSCIIIILENIIYNIYFDELRTKGKLGYVVSVKLINLNINCTFVKPNLKLLLQSNKIKAKEIVERSIEIINTKVYEKIKELNDEEFNSLKNGVLSDFESPITNISSRDKHIKLCIEQYINDDGNIDYNYKIKIIEALNKLSIIDLQTYFIDNFIKNPKITKIGIEPKNNNNISSKYLLKKN